jgi:hypothetical protein
VRHNPFIRTRHSQCLKRGVQLLVVIKVSY